MAVLSDADRVVVFRRIMERLSHSRVPISITKADLRAAVNAVDDWINTNAAAYNTAIPQPARGALTASQKAELLSAVALRKFEV